MNDLMLLSFLTGIIGSVVVAVFFCMAWSVWAPEESGLRRKLCRLMHGKLAMYAGGKDAECWCGLKWDAPWRNNSA